MTTSTINNVSTIGTGYIPGLPFVPFRVLETSTHDDATKATTNFQLDTYFKDRTHFCLDYMSVWSYSAGLGAHTTIADINAIGIFSTQLGAFTIAVGADGMATDSKSLPPDAWMPIDTPLSLQAYAYTAAAGANMVYVVKSLWGRLYPPTHAAPPQPVSLEAYKWPLTRKY